MTTPPSHTKTEQPKKPDVKPVAPVSEGMEAVSSQDVAVTLGNLQSARPETILRLQRVAGNRAVTKLLQRNGLAGQGNTHPAIRRAQDEEDEKLQAKSLATDTANESASGTRMGPLWLDTGKSAKSGASPVLQPKAEPGKLTVSEPGDQQEIEADQVAEQVMKMPDRAAPPPPDDDENKNPNGNAILNRYLQRNPIQRAGDGIGGGAVNEATQARIEGMQQGGKPLPDSEREFFEPRMGVDLSNVRVHTDSTAADTSKELNARAYTVGPHVAFNSGEFQPGTTEGRKLLGHELTHVVQQGAAVTRKPKVQRALSIEEAAKEAVAEVTPADVEKQDVGPIEAEPVEMPEKNVELEKASAGSGDYKPAGGKKDGQDVAAAQATTTIAAPEAAPAAQTTTTAVPEPAPAAQTTTTAASEPAPAAQTTTATAAPGAAPAAQTTTTAAPEPAPAAQTTTTTAAPEAAPAAQTTTTTAAPGAAPAASTTATSATSDAAPAVEKVPTAPAAPGVAPAAEKSPTASATPETVPVASATPETAPAAAPAQAASAAPEAAPAAAQAPAASATPETAPAAAPAPTTSATPEAAPSGSAAAGASGPSPDANPAFQGVVNGVAAVAANEQKHEPGEQTAAKSAAAAEMPEAEKMGKAQDVQAGSLENAAEAQENKAKGGKAPGFDKEAFVSAVEARITELTPKDPKKMENIKESGVFGQIQSAIDGMVQAGKEGAQGDIDDKAEEKPNEDAIPDKQVTALQANDPGSVPAPVNTQGAVPVTKQPSVVEQPLADESRSIDDKMAQADVTEEQLEKSQEPSFEAAVKSKRQAQAQVKEDAQTYRAGEKDTLNATSKDAQQMEGQLRNEMHQGRAQSLTGIDKLQTETKSQDEGKRAEIGKDIDKIYTDTETAVTGILTELDTKVDEKFNTGATDAKNAATEYIERETKKYKDERYNKDDSDLLDQGLGLLQQGADAVMGMPDEYYEIYNKGRQIYVDKMKETLNQVADIVAQYLTSAKDRVTQGRTEIDKYVESQPKALREVAEKAAGDASSKFDSLEETVDSKQQELVDKLAQNYTDAVKSLDDELSEMKKKDGGLLQQVKDAVGDAVGTIVELGKNLARALGRAAHVIDKILKDPGTFVGHLVDAVKQGFENFGKNIGVHLQAGLINWLTGALDNMGIKMPEKFDLPGIFDLVTQILGISMEKILDKVAKAIGPKGKDVIDGVKAAWNVYEAIQAAGGGLAGLWKFVQDQLSNLKEMVIEQIKSMVTEQIVKAGSEFLLTLLAGPAGPFIKAVQAIISIVTWFMDNAGRITTLINSILDSVEAIAQGNIGAAAQFIEDSLVKALPTVIDFLAKLLHVDDIVKKVKKVIDDVRAMIDKALDPIIKTAVAIGKGLLSKLGFGKKKEKAPGPENDDENGQEVTANFSMNGESHTLSVVPGANAQVQMASAKKDLLSNKIGRVVGKLKREAPQDAERIDALIALGGKAKKMQQIKKSSEQENTQDQYKAALDDLATSMNAYAEQYGARDIEDVTEGNKLSDEEIGEITVELNSLAETATKNVEKEGKDAFSDAEKTAIFAEPWRWRTYKGQHVHTELSELARSFATTKGLNNAAKSGRGGGPDFSWPKKKTPEGVWWDLTTGKGWPRHEKYEDQGWGKGHQVTYPNPKETWAPDPWLKEFMKTESVKNEKKVAVSQLPTGETENDE